MTALTHVRQRALACRQIIGEDTAGRLQRVIAYLLEVHGIETHPVNAAFLDGGQAEVSPAEGCLFYNAQLDDDAAQKLVVMLHELGHLELHHRLQGDCATPDPVLGSMYLNDGAAALARYNPRAREEAEANAFATAFLCPSHEVLAQWLDHPQMDSAELAQRLEVPKSIVHAQLAEGLYQMVVEPSPQSRVETQATSNALPTCDASQLAAATCTGRPVLVNAGPGTGKTTTLVRRIAHLIDDCNARPEQLLVLTFSNDAADELRQRIAAYLGDARAARIEVSTFHGFGVKFLHHHGQFFNLDADASVLDEEGQEALVSHLLGAVPCRDIVALHQPEATVKQIVRHIGYLKDRLYTADDFSATLDAWNASGADRQDYDAARLFADVYRAYEAAKQAQQRVDFADLIALPQRILASNDTLRSAYQAKYKWVMVDEYQDVGRSVAGLLSRLCGPQNPPWVVGDTRQAIYRFRGAAPENVDLFEDDFSGAQIFHLDTNYRSSEAILAVANQLAALMAPDANGDTTHWRYGSATTSPSTHAVAVAHAESDAAQYEGIATQIGSWLQQGVNAADIAVLARRNLDVRDISLALGRHGIHATTSGTATPEGLAGDLAAIVTLADQPQASLPRLALALGRERVATNTLNAVIRQALETWDANGTFDTSHEQAGVEALATEMAAVCTGLQAERFSGDAFTMMCAFLFDCSDVLRHTLAAPPSTERALALSDTVTCLSKAAAYRFLHPDTEPQAARLGFAQHFRATLGSSPSSVTPPKSAEAAVRVMTCHAAKGLEFPYVIVAGQTLPAIRSQPYTWLPPALAPAREEPRQQADALFFVGVTRAQQAVVVTYATSASARARAGKREPTPLLARWLETHAVPTSTWPADTATRQSLTIDAIWGGTPRGLLTVRALDSQTCAIRTYLEHYLNIRFPVAMRPLYPVFFDTVRRTMGRIVQRAHELGKAVPHDEARTIFDNAWPSDEVADHPHHDLYWTIGLDYVQHFARAYQPHPQAQNHLGLSHRTPDSDLPMRYDLLAHYQAVDGARVAIALRTESLQSHARPDGVLWSGLSSAQRTSFVMLKQHDENIQPWVFSAKDGALYPYQWPRNAKNVDTEAERVAQRFNSLDRRQFETTAQTWACDRCPVRVSCPVWMGVTDHSPG